ncbi:hypothetical protein GE061_010349 [Apolygus lucorum]|uniref:Fatty acid synthase n=1 Tax=Apolygus lucorum TaxID=248454 RepID=A0A8S9Y341_APOLU|nr:hypothetical protein GE061_010349 [Apolygus lucorum]
MDEIVISGFSGKFPECENVQEFEEKLYAGTDMVTADERRWPVGLHGLPSRNGKLKDLSRFDAAFFGVSPKQADAMDPQLRILIENTYEAILDSGYNPEELRGKKIGVFVGQTANETLDLLGRDPETLSGYGMSGANRAMTANRISFTFDFRGPSFTIDTACSSSLVAFHLGVSAIQRGEVEAAIVAGVNILLTPHTSLMYNRLNMLSEDGTCRAFDSSGSGYVRSETTGAFLIQKSNDARRVYARILATGANVDGHKELGITYPIGERQKVLISEVLGRASISPSEVAYVEAHGTGTKVGDPQEVNSLHALFCSGVVRPSPLFLGSVKSNIGHAESAAAIGQLSKVILAMERGLIPGNLHFKTPNPDIPGLKDGSMKVVDKNYPWSSGIVSINSFGFGGANANAILKSNSKVKKPSEINKGIPKLIVCSGRTEQAVEKILQKGMQEIDNEGFLCLLNEIHKINTPGHSNRGFLLEGDQNTSIVETPPKREVWYLFSGMGSQWVGMGRQLLTMAPFARSIERCNAALKTVGVDLMDLINSNSEATLDVSNSFICIASIQVAMVDLLTELGVSPDGILGHSAGELACAYADGGFTPEETVLAAHSRGLAIKSCNVKGGAMAAIAGLTWEQVKAKLPANVYAACHNSKDSVTISGKEEDVQAVVKKFEAEGITARSVNSSGIAFHSPYVALASPALVDSIKKVSVKSGVFEQVIDLKKEEMSFLAGHVIDGRILFPATGYLTLVWRAFAKLEGIDYRDLPVVLADIHIHRATVLTSEGSVKLTVNIFHGTGRFEIADGETHVVTGRIARKDDESDLEKSTFDATQQSASLSNCKINADDVYKELKLRQYGYTGAFRGVKYSDVSGKSGCLEWNDNWVTFLDTMLQFFIVGNDTRELYLPVRMEKVIINPKKHKECISSNRDVSVYSVRELSIIKSGGVEIRNLKNNHARKRPISQGPPKLEQHVFVPYRNNKEMTRSEAMTCALQIVMENSESSAKIKTMEIANNTNSLLSPLIANVLLEEPNIVADISVITNDPSKTFPPIDEKKVKVLKQSIEVALTGNVNVVIVHNLADNNQLLINISTHLKAGCFVISEEVKRKDILSSLEIIAEFPFEKRTLLLLRKTKSNEDLTVMKLDENNFAWVEQVKNWMRKNGNSGRKLLLSSKEKTRSGIIGFFRCLRLEENGASVRVMLISDEGSLNDKALEDQMQKGLAVNVFRNGVWGSYRHLKLSDSESSVDVKGVDIPTLIHTQHAYVNTLVRGDLSSLQWIESQTPTIFSRGNGIGKELCTVYYAPLNFRDIMLATGKLPPDALPGNLADQDCVLGLEFAGRDSEGRRVIGIVEACGMATSVAADKGFLWEIPDEWSLEEASTVPIVYSTAYYALIVRGNLRKGESVLIHAGSGGVGMAAIAIALNMGCKVFTTVGTQSKRSFLLRTFNKLNSSMIGNSRDTSFEWMVLNSTAGKGVNVVLNSLAGEQLLASVRCLAEGGRFLEIGKVDLSNNSALGMAVFLKNTTFHGILLDALFQVSIENPEKAEVSRLMQEGIRSGEVRPLPVTVFQNTQLEEAFRYMATGKHIGKVVLKIRQEELERIVEPRQEFVSAISKTYLDRDKSYIIVGGLGGFGLELAEWLVTRGATKLVLTSRSGVTNGFQELSLRRWRAKSVQVLISTTDCTTQSGAQKLIASANQLGPVGGIYNLAGVLRDGEFVELKEQSFEEVSAAKVRGSYWLDMSSRAACPQLDHFVAFSSVSCGRGNAGQTNYGYANSGLERVCENRNDEGFPALAIQWGAIGDVGMVMKDLKGGEETKVAGTLPQKIISCLNSLDVFLSISTGQRNLPKPLSAVVSSLVLANKGMAASTSSAATVTISSIVSNIMGIKDVKRAGDATLAELGMDSLMGTEIKQALEINLDLPSTEYSLQHNHVHIVPDSSRFARVSHPHLRRSTICGVRLIVIRNIELQ